MAIIEQTRSINRRLQQVYYIVQEQKITPEI